MDDPGRINPTYLTVNHNNNRNILLLVRSAIEELTLGPVKIKDLLLIQKFIPVVVAYLFYELIFRFIRWDRTERVYEALMDKFHNRIYKNDLEYLLFPPVPMAFSLSSDPRMLRLSRLLRLQDVVGYVLTVIFLLGPLAFQLVAYSQLLGIDVSDLATWFSLALALFLTVATYVVLCCG